MVEKINAQFWSALKLERVYKKWTSWAGTSQISEGIWGSFQFYAFLSAWNLLVDFFYLLLFLLDIVLVNLEETKEMEPMCEGFYWKR